MERKHVAAISVAAVAVLLPLGRWVVASRQDTADAAASRSVERRFASRQMAAGGVQQPDGGSPRRPGGRRGPWGQGAQGGWGGQQGPQGARMVERMTQAVGLTPTQAKQIQAIRDSSRPLMSDIFRNPQLSREQKRAQTQQIRQAQQEQITRILSPAQQAKYTAFEQKMQADRQAQRRQNGGGAWFRDGQGGRPGAGGPGEGGQG